MIGHRTRYSLAQLLEQQEPAIVVTILAKHGARAALSHSSFMYDLLDVVRGLSEYQVLEILKEVVATANDLRGRITPKHRFDVRMHDLGQCLLLDGYEVNDKRLLQTDPAIADAPPIDDDLIEALKIWGAQRSNEIIQKISDSAQAFRTIPPDYNASLVNARVALETLVGDVALDIANGAPLTINLAKWGEVLSYLRTSGEVTVEEEQGLAGVFRFLSPGAHRPIGIGIPEAQMARLGRSFALNMCWFLLQNRLVRRKL